MSSCAHLDPEWNSMSHPDPDEDRTNLSSRRILWAKIWDIAMFLPRSKSALGSRPDKEDALLSVHERAAQCAFLCLDSSEGAYAIQIPCLRSGPRRLVSRRLEEDHNGILRFIPGGEVYEQPVIRKEAFEDDAAIWSRMTEASFNFKGLWKQRLPFFGPIAVREVTFQFVGTQDLNGRFEIFDMMPVNEEIVRKQANRTIASVPDEVDSEYGNGCIGFSHSTKCPASLKDDLPCILDMAEAAHLRKRKLDMLFFLKNCARNPRKANGLRTLEGMAQESCVYDLEGIGRIHLPQRDRPYTQRDVVRGIEIEIGWQLDRIVSGLPLSISWTWFCLAFIWFAVIMWEGKTKDWGNAMAFGQLLAASLSLIVVHANV